MANSIHFYITREETRSEIKLCCILFETGNCILELSDTYKEINNEYFKVDNNIHLMLLLFLIGKLQKCARIHLSLKGMLVKNY